MNKFEALELIGICIIIAVQLYIFYRTKSKISVFKSIFPESDEPKVLGGLRRLSRALFELRHRPRNGYVHDYDKLDSPSKQRTFLARRRGVEEAELASWGDERVEQEFFKFRDSQIRMLEADHGKIS